MENNNSSGTATNGTPQLRRVLGLWDLIYYGIIINSPVAAVGLFGLVSSLSQGHMVFTLLLSMVAMLLTAASYGRMATYYPSAGSAFTYVGQGLNPHLGFLAGWAMILVYLVIPVINTVFGVLSFQRIFPGVPFYVGVIGFAAILTFFNLLGIRSSMNANKIMLYVMLIIIGAFIILAIRYILGVSGMDGLFEAKTLYNPETFSFSHIAAGTSLVALTYVGFDGITTLAEEVKNPKRNILLAIIVVCLFTGLFSSLQMYLSQQTAQSMWLTDSAQSNVPFYDRIPKEHMETAFMTVCAQVGGSLLFNAMIITMFIASLGSGMAGQLGAARLLYGMGKTDVLPRKFFSHIDKKHNTPVYNVLLIGILTVIASLALNYQRIAELINFGALIAFMGVNLAAIKKLYFNSEPSKRNILTDLIVPAAGFLFCLWIWWSLPNSPKILGGIWFLVGFIYLAISTKGFRKKPVELDFKEV